MRKTLYIQFLLGVLLWAVPAPAAAGPRRFSARISPLSDSLRKTAKVPDPAARDAFRSFAKKTGTDAWRVRYSPKTALPEAIVGAKTHGYPGTPEEAAIAFLNDNKDLLKVDTGQLRRAYSKVFMGVTHIQYEQIYNSIPVEFAYVRVHIDSSGRVAGYQAKFEPEINVPLSPAFPAAYAENAALSDLGFSARVTAGTLVLFPDPEAAGALKLAWKIRARAANTANGVWIYYVGAGDGRILFRYNDLRYACPVNANSTGTVKGAVYPISPTPTGNSDLPASSWIQPVAMAINNQYVWITGSLNTPTPAVSGVAAAIPGTVAGDYCGSAAGKVFASLKGPYFSVVNFRGPSAHFDNGGGVWRSTPTPVRSSGVPPYSITVPNDWESQSQAFAKVMPHFASFSVGGMDITGNFTNPVELHVTDAAGSKVGSYIGSRTNPFFGAAVENRAYGLILDAASDGGAAGSFEVDISSYLVLTDNPIVRNNATGSIVWSPGAAGVFLDGSLGNAENAVAEVNAFYHLNGAYDYFKLVNRGPSGNEFAGLSSEQVPVMVHAHGAADTIAETGGMENAFYDLEKDNIFLGDGRPDSYGNYRSFALDGTIIRHEYVHRVVNKIYPIINFGEFGAVSEAMADYFSLASLTHEGAKDAGQDVSMLGNFLGAGEGTARDLAGAPPKRMPDNWAGEVHDDGLILSQALWQLKNSTPTTATDLGNFGPAGAFPNMPKADVFAYAALFYFPDNFANFYDAFVDACAQLDPAGCPAGGAARARIAAAFSAHGIPSYSTSTYSLNNDGYDQPVPGTLCPNNNGPECATDISTMASLSATIFPAGDIDYYTIPLQEGNFTAALGLPAAAGPEHYAYTLYLFDADRKIARYPDGRDAIAAPVISNNYYDYCPASGDCLTNSSGVSLSYSVTSPGRYYLAVSGSSSGFGNSRVASTLPYSLNLSYTPRGSASADIDTAVYDRDTISFSVPYAKFPMLAAPSSATLTGAEAVFEYAQLRDHNYQPLSDARTNASGSFLSVAGLWPAGELVLDKTVIKGKVSLNPGFANRYPGVGTVYLEVFGRNHMGSVVSLGVSNAINLTTNKSDLVTYNNILTGAGDRAIVKYDLQSGGELTIRIYTVTGSLVKTVFSGNVGAGKGTTDWDGTNSGGSKVASGIYYIKANGPGLNKTDKIAVVR